MYRHRNIGNFGPSASPSSGPSAQTCGGSIGCPSSLIHAAAINTSRADQARRCMWTLMPRVGASFFFYLLLFIYFLFVLAVLFGFFFLSFFALNSPGVIFGRLLSSRWSHRPGSPGSRETTARPLGGGDAVAPSTLPHFNHTHTRTHKRGGRGGALIHFH